MAGKGKIVRGALEELTDLFKKEFDPETYYHGTVSDIKSFEPQEKYYLKPISKKIKNIIY